MKLILLTYENRSGSTFLTKQLSSNQILCCPESDALTNLLEGVNINNYKKFLLNDVKQREWGIKESEYKDIEKKGLDNFSIFNEVLLLYHKSKNSISNYILFKTTQVPFLKEEVFDRLFDYYEDIFVIQVNRNPLSIYNSQKVVIQSKTGKPMEFSALKFIFRVFKRQQKITKIKLKIIQISFENLILNTENELKKIMVFLKIEKLDQINYIVGASQAHLHNRKKIDLDQAKRKIDNLNFIEIFFLKNILKKNTYLYRLLFSLFFLIPILINDLYNFITQKNLK